MGLMNLPRHPIADGFIHFEELYRFCEFPIRFRGNQHQHRVKNCNLRCIFRTGSDSRDCTFVVLRGVYSNGCRERTRPAPLVGNPSDHSTR